MLTNDVRRPHRLMALLSSRVVRGGPKLLASTTACLVLGILVLTFTSQRLSLTATGAARTAWQWRSGESWHETQTRTDEQNTLGYGPDGLGNLRIVVFGEQDVATPRWTGNAETAKTPGWTDVLCKELHCSTYQSFVPGHHDQDRPMVSVGIYAQALEEAAVRTVRGTGPGEDYSFQPEEYPLSWRIQDLGTQITAFLDGKPSSPPRETLWVITVGMWDIWSLASLPLDMGLEMVDLMTDHVFEQADRLYKSSLTEASVAWSDTNGRLQNETVRTLQNRTDMFRILIPKLLDPSLIPAWSTARPDLGEVHSKAEQTRNAAQLTAEWNMHLFDKLERWIRGADAEDDDEGSRRSFDQAAADAQDTASDILTLYGISHETGDGDSARQEARSSSTQPEWGQRRVPEKHPRLSTEQGDTGTPQRDGFLYDLPRYVLDVMTERQLRDSGLQDGNGRGGRQLGDGFRDVRTPCLADMRRDGKEDAGSTLASRLCEVMQKHLFSMPFVVAPRAVKEIGHSAAEMVRRNEMVRAGRGGY